MSLLLFYNETSDTDPAYVTMTLAATPQNGYDGLTECDIGDRVFITATLEDDDQEPVTGANVTARSLHTGTETSLAVADNGNGTYTAVLEPDAPGKWEIRFDSTDPNLAAEEGIIWVRRTSFTTS